MPSTSPYSNNDYAAVSNFRPYELPINDIFKGISAQNAFWDAGAARVKHIYDNILDMPLTLDSNKEVRKQYMEDAQKQLSKLSTMDLGDPSVQRQGFNLFKPLLSDQALLYDSELTKTMQGIYSDANGYRKTKLSSTGPEGEGYTQRNLAYALDGFEEFNPKTARDPELLKGLYGKLGRKQYSPYYNPQQEYDSILKHCKGTATEGQDVASNYMYFNESSKSGASAGETGNCFMEGLSDKAKEQMGIDGWAYYKMNPHLLVTDHHAYAIGPQQTALDSLSGKLAALKDIQNPTEDNKATIKKLQDMLPTLQKNLDDRQKEYINMVGNNPDQYIKENFNQIAAGIYMSKQYMDLGEAFKSDKYTNKLTANAAGIAQFNAIEKAYAQQREHDYRKDELKQKYLYDLDLKQQSGEIAGNKLQTINPTVTEGIDTGQNYGSVQAGLEQKVAHDVFTNSFNSLHDYILAKDPNQQKQIDKLGWSNFLLNYVNNQSKLPKENRDRQFTELITSYNNAKEEVAGHDLKQKAIDAVVNNQFSSQAAELKKTVITLSDGTVITGDALANIRQNDIQRVRDNSNTSISKHERYSYTINGKVYDDGGSGLFGSKFFSEQQTAPSSDIKQLNEFFRRNGELVTGMQNAKDDLYRKTYYQAERYVAPRVDPKKNMAVDMAIKNALGVQGGEAGKKGYKLLGHDINGQNLIVIPTSATGDDVWGDQTVLANAKTYNSGATEVDWGGKKAIMLPYTFRDIPNLPTPQQKSQINKIRDFKTLMERQLQFSKKSYMTSEDVSNPDGTMFPYSSYSFTTPFGANVKVIAVKSNGQVSLMPSVQLKDGSWDTNYNTFTDPEQLVLSFTDPAKPQ